jgi:DNA polymerase elongation subunit (family B)
MKLVTVEYVESNQTPYIVYFTREDGLRQRHVVEGFRPYFYVLLKEMKGYTTTIVEPIKSLNISSQLIEDSTIYKAIDGEDVVKVFAKVPEDVPQLCKNYDKFYETQVHFTTRWLIDCVDKIDKSELRIQYTDIEKDPASNRIISIAVYDSYLQKCIAFAWRDDLTPSRKDAEYSFPSGYKFKASIHLYNSRTKMLSDYIQFVKDTDPDILTGWFFVKYDAKELINEINSLRLHASDLSPLHKAYVMGDQVSELESNIKIAGRVLWDMLKAYSFLQQGRLPDASLEAIAQKELNEGKHPHKPFSQLWNDIDELIEYNCKDSVLVKRIDEKKHLIQHFDTIRRFVGGEWNSAFFETLLWDCYLLRKVHNKIVLPPKNKIKTERFKGAKVLIPASKGIHRNIILIDLKGLYPSIIITLNMSPEVMTEDKTNANNLPNGVSFKKEPVGLLPEVLLELMQLREEYKANMKKYPYGTSEYETFEMQQFAIKVLMNALYGAMAYENFRLVTPKLAESIPFVGRNVLDFIIKTIEQMGFKVIYGDTDSIFIQAESKEPYYEMMNIIKNLNDKLPQFMKEFANTDKCTIIIEPKKIYESLMISEKKSGVKRPAQKRYAGIISWAEGEFIDKNSEKSLDVVGFESKRSDSSALSRDLQKKVIRMLLEGAPLSDQKAYISQVIQSIINGVYEFEYVGITKGLSKNLGSYLVDNPHRRAAIYSNENLGTKFGLGDKPRIIYVSSTGKYPKTDVIAFMKNEDIPPDFKMDVDTMIRKTVVEKTEHIFSAAGIDINEILHERKRLEDFF